MLVLKELKHIDYYNAFHYYSMYADERESFMSTLNNTVTDAVKWGATREELGNWHIADLKIRVYL